MLRVQGRRNRAPDHALFGGWFGGGPVYFILQQRDNRHGINMTAHIAVALSVPQFVPIATSDEIIPRLPFGAYSASMVPAPEISAPAPNP